MLLKLFTWNMQRGGTSATTYTGEEYRRVNLRYGLLQDLCNRSDFGFITEPGPNLRQSIRKGERPLHGYCHMSNQTDTQNDDSACRPILFSNRQSRFELTTPIHSGAQDANRYPAARQFHYNRHKLVVVALHATSGRRSGLFNTIDVIDTFIEYMKGEGAGGLIVGGDFNHHFDGSDRSDGKVSALYAMPSQPTNQGAPVGSGGIDGFYFCTNYGSTAPIEFSYERITRYQSSFHGSSEFHTTAQNPQFAGFWILDKHPKPGTQAHMYRVSDHCPVMLKVTLRLR